MNVQNPKRRIAILAHRANVRGPSGPTENSHGLCAEALQRGFGLEIDLRRDVSGRFYISHDPAPISEANSLDGYRALFGRFPDAVLAVNVKELGYEEELIRLQQSGAFGSAAFYFDFELLEQDHAGRTQRRLRLLPGGAATPLAARASDRGESIAQAAAIPAQYIWADEFDRDWLDAAAIAELRALNRRVFVVSPELHGRDREARLARWHAFKAWGIDGICTDYSLEAEEFFTT